MFKYDYKKKVPLKVTFPSWDLNQLYHQIDIAINSTETIKREHLTNWVLSKTLKGKIYISYKESNAFITVLRAFSNYLQENKRELIDNEEKLGNIIRSVFVVKDNFIISSSLNDKLNAEIKEAISTTNYEFRTDLPVFEEDEK